jgi:hypothetical protein
MEIFLIFHGVLVSFRGAGLYPGPVLRHAAGKFEGFLYWIDPVETSALRYCLT